MRIFAVNKYVLYNEKNFNVNMSVPRHYDGMGTS